jgi:hypothetical protein
LTTEAAGSKPRANRDGDPCDDWCVTDHSRLVIEGLYADTHLSEPLAAHGCMQVIVTRYPGHTPEVLVMGATGSASAGRSHYDIKALAALLDHLAGQPRGAVKCLADGVREGLTMIEGK